MTARHNYLTNETVFIAEHRADRPIETAAALQSSLGRYENVADCPFCPGNEHMLAEGVYNSARVRIVRNKFPFVEKPVGEHYVLIDTPRHDESICNFSHENIAEIFTAAKFVFSNEYLPHNLGNRACLQLYKNDGPRAGASLFHSHWQITALATPPANHTTVMANFHKYSLKQEAGVCYICDDIKQDNYRVYENEYFVAFCPFAPRFPHEVNIVTKAHTQSLTELEEAEMVSLGEVLSRVLRGLSAIIPDFNFNITLQEGGYADKISHFILRICPRVGSIAGFEITTGIYTHSKPPEKTVELLRAVIDK